MAATGFHKTECSLCQRTTWHYKEGDKPAHCTNHSTWNPNRRHAVVGTVMQAQLTRTVQAPTERELRIANRLDMDLWRHAEEQRKTCVDITQSAQGIFPVDTTVRDPDKLYCTFCGDEVDQVRVTTERKPVVRVKIDTYKDTSGEVHVQERVVTRAETIHACPNCCLRVRKPIVARRV
jgi:hypothetical protein